MQCSFQASARVGASVRLASVSPDFGGDSEGATPLPIPNRAVKPLSADGTWASRPWESRSPPFISKGRPSGRPFFVPAHPYTDARMTFAPIAISTFAIVLIGVAVVFAVFVVLGFVATRARDRRQAGTWEEAVRSADAALAQAAATDRGWHREAMESAARAA